MKSHERLGVGMVAIAFLLVVAALAACATSAAADGIQGSSKIAAPQTSWVPPALDSAPESTWRAHNWYVGLVGGHAWVPDEAHKVDIDDTWHGGIVGGYLWRPSPMFGVGVEADYVVRDLSYFDAGDGVASLRGRAGVFLEPSTFAYLTAGVAQATDAIVPDGFRQGLVVGGGIERDVLKGVALRAEVLHYRHADDYFEWGDHGSTALRLGIIGKF